MGVAILNYLWVWLYLTICGCGCSLLAVGVVAQILDQGDFLELSSHILRGDQLIVRGSDVSTVTSVLNVLKVRSMMLTVLALCICVYMCTNYCRS